MGKYTGNYSYTNHNFIIENIRGPYNYEDTYYQVICVIQNILLRGRANKSHDGERGQPTIMSKFLQKQLGVDIDINDKESKDYWFDNIIAMIDREVPIWEGTIKGFNNDNPALQFFKEIPILFPQFRFIQQLIIPECKIKDILDNDVFTLEAVDFYLPQTKLVIEIDGLQHKRIEGQLDDRERDFHLRAGSIKVVRIDTYDFKNRTDKYMEKIREINQHLIDNWNVLSFFEESFKKNKEDFTRDELLRLRATEILRNQICILELLRKNKISFNDMVWNFSITGNIDEDSLKLGIEDIFRWARPICQLAKINFKEPKVIINNYPSLGELRKAKGIKIDSNIMKRTSDVAKMNRDIIFVRTEHLDFKNHFELAVAESINYRIIKDDERDQESIRYLLFNIFGFNDFRDGQLNIIVNSLERKDTIGLLPTGSGKSLCYQFVSMLQPSISLVICPIKSLMYDQKDNLDRIHIGNTNTITSDLSPKERNTIMKEFESGKYSILWISPERFQVQEFRNNLKRLDDVMNIGMGIIDEVHCLSEWGHDFRTSYLNLISTLRKYSSNICLLGLTATASSFVLEDLKKEFDIDSMDIKTIESYDREELNFHVETIPDRWALEGKLFSILDDINKELNFKEDYSNSVLVFTKTKGGKKGCHHLSNSTSTRFKMKVPFYSGSKPKGLSMNDQQFNDHKNTVQKGYKNNEFPLLFATKAFGMGIDKSNIRATIHCGIPSSLESLYQEAGRAGRDKKEANCYIIYQEDKWKNEEDKNLFFKEDISTKELKDIFEDYEVYEQGDVLGNFFFYLHSTKGMEFDFKVMKLILDEFAKPNSSTVLSRDKLNNKGKSIGIKVNSQEEIQKAIYRLKLIGIVEDWLVERWEVAGRTGLLKVFFTDYSEESVRNTLTAYIKRYTPNFKYENTYLNSLGKGKYTDLKYKNDGIYEYVEFLLIWIYDNILYNRRKSIENITKLCKEYTDSKSFKKEIDRYFKFTDETYSLDHIAQNPNNIYNWYELLTDYDESSNTTTIIGKEKLLDIRGSLMRMFESYRYNEGLDYIDALSYLLLNNGELESIYEEKLRYVHENNKKISNFELLYTTLDIVSMSKIENKENISKLLCEIYPENIDKIYNNLKDNYSLNQCIISYLSRLKEINEVTVNGKYKPIK